MKNNINEWFDALFYNSVIGIILIDSEGIIQEINPYLLERFQFDKQEIIGQKVEILIPLRHRILHENLRIAYKNDPESRIMGCGMDIFGRKKDGSEFPVEVLLSKKHKDGKEYMLAFVTDLSHTDKNIAHTNCYNDPEQTIKLRTQALQETMEQMYVSKEHLEKAMNFQKALLFNAGATIIVTDETGLIQIFNPEAVKNLGYAEAEVVNKMTPVAFHNKSEIDQKRKELLMEFGVHIKNDFEVLTEKARRNIPNQEQYTYVRKDGSTFPASSSKTAMRDLTGKITGYISIVFNIFEITKAENDLKESLKREKVLGELKSRFVSMASHEFRTPLSTILSSAYLIEKYGASEEQNKRVRHLQRIISSVNMLTDILNDILSLGKIEEGRLQVKSREINLDSEIHSIINEMNPTLKKNQKIQFRHKGSSQVCLDPVLLKHIIMNLISNASKFSSEGGIIEVTANVTDASLKLEIGDHGIGIPKEDQKHLMERFFRGANVNNIQGTGLGLHIVSKYAELMNGTINITSELEVGTRIEIKFTKNKGCYEKDIVD
ncbi:MAG: PAS domain S-box protein [Bacteroidota bacterium]|nr:PAS domain S-box protein [Bacteroidota bacterium]